MSKIHIRLGEIELSLESEGSSFESELGFAVTALDRMAALTRENPLLASTPSGATASATPPAASARMDVGINSVVAKLGGGSARELLRSAAVHLSLVDGLETFSREALIKRAHSARDWQAGYTSNQARDLKRMVDQDDLLEKTGGSYSLPTKALDEARRALAND